MSNVSTGIGRPYSKTPQNQFSDIYELLNYIAKEPQPTKLMNKQEQSLNAVRAGAYIVGSIDADGNLYFSPQPAIHTSPQSARQECVRLAQMYPGKAFVFTKLAGAELVPKAATISI